MAYQALALKYRPHDFSSMVGQDHVVRALTNALRTNRLHHAYLFTGTRGVGKTTVSRILAKSLNCIGPDGNGTITDTPCGQCHPCQAIDKGNFVDYIEMDAASNRGVDDMTNLLERAMYAPAEARVKVYMIDEVHMLSNQAFNAMLKTLEEPPPYVKFILATTDAHKIPVTVLSRCLQFSLKQMPLQIITEYLTKVLAQEQIKAEPAALALLAKGAHGSMRDALSLTDQAIVYTNGTVSLAGVREMIGMADSGYLLKIADALLAEDGTLLFEIAAEINQQGLSFPRMLEDLANLWQQLALLQAAPQALDRSTPDFDTLCGLAKRFSAEQLQVFYQITLHSAKDLGLAPDEFSGFTMLLIRLLGFVPQFRPPTVDTTAAVSPPSPRRESPAETAPLQSSAVVAPPPVVEAVREVPPPQLEPQALSAGTPQVDKTEADTLEKHKAAIEKSEVEHKAVAPVTAVEPHLSQLDNTAAANPVPSATEGAEVMPLCAENWGTILQSLTLAEMTRQLARASECVDFKAGVLTLKIKQNNVLKEGYGEDLCRALAQKYPLDTIKYEDGNIDNSPLMVQKKNEQEVLDNSYRAIAEDPLFKSYQDAFGATLLKDSLRS